MDNSLERRSRASKLTDCPFRMVIRAGLIEITDGDATETGEWMLDSVLNKHNHEPSVGVCQFGRSATRLSERQQAIISESVISDLSVAQTLHALKRRDEGGNLSYKSVAYQVALVRGQMNGDGRNQAMELVSKLEERRLMDDRWFYSVQRCPETSQLESIFWMSPEQRDLYVQYSDVIINDNTSQTNRFGMFLNVSIAIDNAGFSRILACALISRERTEDFIWVLEKIKESGEGKVPEVILVDEDSAMEAAIERTLPDTKFINCIWHMSMNVPRTLAKCMGGIHWSVFKPRFWSIRNTISEEEFEEQWESLQRDLAPMNPRLEKYLQRLHSRRRQWALFWVGNTFTAGAQSTQRVESAHSVIKKALNTQSRLVTLFEALEERSKRELNRLNQVKFHDEVLPSTVEIFSAAQLFASVVKENETYLGSFARNRMVEEMSASLFFEHEQVPTEVRLKNKRKYNNFLTRVDLC